MLLTQRPGSVVKIGKDKKIIPIYGVQHIGEGGLLGLALHPQFEKNNWLYLYLTTSGRMDPVNRVERYTLRGETLVERKTILDGISGGRFHDGGRIAFGPDGYLYITTGDTGIPSLAQNIESLAGKILRIKDDGGIPPDNPFNNAVYSYGHRNPQGITWDDQGRLWSTEHGRSGALSGFDELNVIEKGANYGWPTIQGDEEKAGLATPIAHSGPDVTWAPAAARFYKGSIFFTGLRGEALYEARIFGDRKNLDIRVHLKGQFGRLRGLAIGPDGYFYISTSNTDGRGTMREGDDKIIKIDPVMFGKENS